MHHQYQSVAEFMRHPGIDQTGITEFYTDTVGLSVLRPYENIQMLWAGEDLSFELKYDTNPGGDAVVDESDPTTAQLIPIFRTYDPKATRARVTAAGYAPVREESDEHSSTFFVLGPDSQVTGFEYRSEDSPLLTDIEALRRRSAGDFRLGNIEPLIPDLQYLSRIRRNCTDIDRTTTFFTAALGLDVFEHTTGRTVLSLGDTVVLELVPGGVEHELPTNRNDAASAVIVRVHDLDIIIASALAAGARPVGPEVVYPAIRIQYIADPDGALFGLLQRGDARHGVVDELAGIEDIEAAKRWQHAKASQTVPITA